MSSNHFNYYVSQNACCNIVESQSLTCISFHINSHGLSRCWNWLSPAAGVRMINLENLEMYSLLFLLCTSFQMAHTKFIINFCYKNRGHRKNDPKRNLKWKDHVQSLIQKLLFFLQQQSFSSASNRSIDSPFRLLDLSNEAWILVYILWVCLEVPHTFFYDFTVLFAPLLAVATCRNDCLQCWSWPTLHTPWNVWVGAEISITQNRLDHWS